MGKCLLNIKITDDYAQAGRGTWSSPSASLPTARTRTASSIANSALCRFHRASSASSTPTAKGSSAPIPRNRASRPRKAYA
ncbi:hypothetical protein ZWY2020_021478 [Hordeum vulgare]|nr:hypothetical protein ZWY2020_021478 [Hordeum vulgare]